MKIIKSTPKRLDYSNPFMEVNHTRADFGAFTKDYFVIELGPRAGVVAVRNGEVLLARQYRFLIDAMSWEIPGGKTEPGESPADAAVRECREETGITCRNVKPLVVYYPGLDNFNNRTTLLYSEDIEVTAPFVGDASEVTEIAWVGLERCIDMVRRGEILDALTVTGLLAYRCLAAGKAGRRRPA